MLVAMLRLNPLAMGVALFACSCASSTSSANETPSSPASDTLGTKATPGSAKIGELAPDFSLADLDGKAHKLSDYRGKIVVLEWFNPECPFVRYAHTEGPLVSMASHAVADGIVWLAINSGAPGKQGHGVEANRAGAATYGIEHPILLDETGAVGHAYDAQKTPHTFVIDAQGTLVFAGGVDNAPIGEVDGDAEKIEYLANALASVQAGKPVALAEPRPYGCTVKYAK